MTGVRRMIRNTKNELTRQNVLYFHLIGQRISVKAIHYIFCFCTLLQLCCITKKQDESSNFECTLTTSQTVYKVGETPDINVSIKNHGEKDVYLVGSLDGSLEKWRLPYCYFEIEKPIIDSISPLARCGNMNSLKKKDFKLVRPNELIDPLSEMNGYFQDYEIKRPEHFRNIGTYKITFFYSTQSDNVKDFIGIGFGASKSYIKTMIEEFSDLFLKVPSLKLKSNTVEILIEH